MTSVFADTHFYVALINRKDSSHAAAVRWASQQRPIVFTSEFVLLEVANFFKQPYDREEFASLVESFRSDPATNIIPCNSAWFQKGLERFAARPDKEWSLTDCISFIMMEESSLTHVLTKDRHFIQAGFDILL